MEDALIATLLGHVPNVDTLLRMAARMVAAVALGAVIGVQRELVNKPAGVRTHALVTLAATIFVMAAHEAGTPLVDLSRIIQGIATGIGFIGAGAILKLRSNHEIRGLTTAATLWTATAVGVAVGLGEVILAFLAVAATWMVLAVFARVDAWIADVRAPARRRAAQRSAETAPR